MEYDPVIIAFEGGLGISGNREVVVLKLTLHCERDEVSACLRAFLRLVSVRKKVCFGDKAGRTLDQSSISSSPTVVLMMTLPLVGRAIARGSMHVTRGDVELE